MALIWIFICWVLISNHVNIAWFLWNRMLRWDFVLIYVRISMLSQMDQEFRFPGLHSRLKVTSVVPIPSRRMPVQDGVETSLYLLVQDCWGCQHKRELVCNLFFFSFSLPSHSLPLLPILPVYLLSLPPLLPHSLPLLLPHAILPFSLTPSWPSSPCLSFFLQFEPQLHLDQGWIHIWLLCRSVCSTRVYFFK